MKQTKVKKMSFSTVKYNKEGQPYKIAHISLSKEYCELFGIDEINNNVEMIYDFDKEEIIIRKYKEEK